MGDDQKFCQCKHPWVGRKGAGDPRCVRCGLTWRSKLKGKEASDRG